MNEKIIEARKMLCRYLVNVAKEKGISQYEIAAKTGFLQSNVNRMLQGRYAPTLDNFIRLAEAVGVYFFVIDKENPDDELVETMKKRWSKFSSDN